jgi:hypothetical protein
VSFYAKGYRREVLLHYLLVLLLPLLVRLNSTEEPVFLTSSYAGRAGAPWPWDRPAKDLVELVGYGDRKRTGLTPAEFATRSAAPTLS